MEMTMTLKVQYLTKLEDGAEIPAGWYVTTPFCPGVVSRRRWPMGALRSYARS
jgi:hypothetical protein